MSIETGQGHDESEQLQEALTNSRVLGTAQRILTVSANVDRAQAVRLQVDGPLRTNIELSDLGDRQRRR